MFYSIDYNSKLFNNFDGGCSLVQSDILFPSILGNESKKGKAFRACNAWYKIK
jgi:hypothetical protein